MFNYIWLIWLSAKIVSHITVCQARICRIVIWINETPIETFAKWFHPDSTPEAWQPLAGVQATVNEAPCFHSRPSHFYGCLLQGRVFLQPAEIHSGHWLFDFKSVREYIECECRTRPPPLGQAELERSK